jgi:hypothetical protein
VLHAARSRNRRSEARQLAGGVTLLALALAACGEKPAGPAGEPPAHVHHAPHGGALEVLGDEAAHVELVLDAKEGRLTAYVLDGEAEKPVRIAQTSLRLTLRDLPGGGATVDLAAVANPLTGETAGDTSQFAGASPSLRRAAKFDGVLATITARGMKFDGVAIGFPGGNEPEKKTDAPK